MKQLIILSLAASSVLLTACVPEMNTPNTDQQPTTWYQDTDVDTFGDPATSFTGDQPDCHRSPVTTPNGRR